VGYGEHSVRIATVPVAAVVGVTKAAAAAGLEMSAALSQMFCCLLRLLKIFPAESPEAVPFSGRGAMHLEGASRTCI
jgi:hypothetical protein